MLKALICPAPIEVFISYSQKDEGMLQQLSNYLDRLIREKLINPWHGQMITPGAEWDKEIGKHIRKAKLILLLVSPDFIASGYSFWVEARGALERSEAGKAIVIPVILRKTDWKSLEFGKYQALPTNGKPVEDWPNCDEAFLDIVGRIREEVKKFRARQVRLCAFIAAFLLACVLLTASQFSPWPRPPATVTITVIPPYSEFGGSTTNESIAGEVSGVSPENYRVVIYALTTTWYVQPMQAEPLTEIRPDGKWEAATHTGKRYLALLVRPDFSPPSPTATPPTRLKGVVAWAEVEGKR